MLRLQGHHSSKLIWILKFNIFYLDSMALVCKCSFKKLFILVTRHWSRSRRNRPKMNRQPRHLSPSRKSRTILFPSSNAPVDLKWFGLFWDVFTLAHCHRNTSIILYTRLGCTYLYLHHCVYIPGLVVTGPHWTVHTIRQYGHQVLCNSRSMYL